MICSCTNESYVGTSTALTLFSVSLDVPSFSGDLGAVTSEGDLGSDGVVGSSGNV